MRNTSKLTLSNFYLFALTCSLITFNSACSNDSKTAATKVALPDTIKTITPKPLKSSSPIPDAATIINRPQVPILCYHQIRDFRPTDGKLGKNYIVPIDNFKEQMKLLHDSGYHTILPDQLYDYLTAGKALPSKPVMLTFDDTRLDQYTVGLSEMNKYGFKGVFFIMTVSLGKPGYMSKEQVKELSDQGNVIGSHTWDHHSVKQYTGDDWTIQIEKPSKELETITGKPIDYFAYPFGLWNKEAIKNLKRYHFKSVFQLSDHRDEEDPLYTIRRIIIPGEWSSSAMMRVMKNSFK